MKLKNNKKGSAAMVFFVIVVGIILIFGTMYILDKRVIDKRMDKTFPWCDGIKPSQTSKYKCCIDCKKIDSTFLKYEYDNPYFSAKVDDCFCYNRYKEAQQIW